MLSRERSFSRTCLSQSLLSRMYNFPCGGKNNVSVGESVSDNRRFRSVPLSHPEHTIVSGVLLFYLFFVIAKRHTIAVLDKYFFLLFFGFSPEFACLFALFIEIASFDRDPGNVGRKAQEHSEPRVSCCHIAGAQYFMSLILQSSRFQSRKR